MQNDQNDLFKAIEEGNPEIVKLLLDNENIDVNKPDKYENTPLQ